VHPEVHITVAIIDMAAMSSIRNILILSLVASHAHASFTGGFLPRASSETRNPTSERAASTLANAKPEGDANAALIGDGSKVVTEAASESQIENEQSDVDASSESDNSDSDASNEEVRSDIEAEASELRQTKQEMEQSDEWLRDAQGPAQQDIDDSQEDDSSKDADQLQSEVSMLEDQVGNEEHTIEAVAPPSSDDDHDDPALLQNDESEVQDESVSSDDGTDVNQAEDDDQDALTTQNDTSMLKELVHNLVSQMHLPDHVPEKRTDPELITVLLQTMNKHASIFGAQQADDADDIGEESDDDVDDDDDSSVDEDADEAGGEADDETSDETDDEDIDDEDSSDDSSDEDIADDDTSDDSSDDSMEDDAADDDTDGQ